MCPPNPPKRTRTSKHEYQATVIATTSGVVYRTIVVLALDEILDNLFLVHSIGMAEQMKGVQGPVHTIDSQMLRERVLERVHFLTDERKKRLPTGMSELLSIAGQV